jgi:hypothetical protein
LSIIRQIVELHGTNAHDCANAPCDRALTWLGEQGGQIIVSSRERLGSTFSVVVPVVKLPGNIPVPDVTPPETRQASGLTALPAGDDRRAASAAALSPLQRPRVISMSRMPSSSSLPSSDSLPPVGLVELMRAEGIFESREGWRAFLRGDSPARA